MCFAHQQNIDNLFRVCLDTTYFTEKWKYCSKIIFKCVNSAMGPIFNESFVEKRNFWVPWTVHETQWKALKCASQWKKKHETLDTRRGRVSKCTLKQAKHTKILHKDYIVASLDKSWDLYTKVNGSPTNYSMVYLILQIEKEFKVNAIAILDHPAT